MDNAFEFIERAGGLCTESSYPYHAREGHCILEDYGCDPVKGTQVVSWVDVSPTEEALKSAITQQPVSVAIEADQFTFQFYSSGVLTGSCGTRLDHGVLAVGYGEDENGTKFWKLRNSWGGAWGEQGYIRIERGKRQEGGQCGVLLMASYPAVEEAVPDKLLPAAQFFAQAHAHQDVLSVTASAKDCGGTGLTFTEFEIPPMKRGEAARMVSKGALQAGLVLSGGDLDFSFSTSEAEVYSDKINMCGEQVISLPLHLGDVHIYGLNCPASGQAELALEMKIPALVPKGAYKILAKGSNASNSNLMCVEVDLQM